MKNRAFGLIEILLVCVIVGFLFAIMMQSYLKQPVAKVSEEKIIRDSGIDTTNYNSVINSTKSKISEITKQLEEQEKGLEMLNIQ